MKIIALIIQIIIGLWTLTACSVDKVADTATSPNGKISLQSNVDENGRPYYRIFFQEQLVMDTSYLGLELDGAPPLVDNFEAHSFDASTFDETWEQPWGEEQHIRNHYNELRMNLVQSDEIVRKMAVIFRVFDDGVGFRYEFPQQESMDSVFIKEEHSQFHLAKNMDAWWIQASDSNRYEYLYRNTKVSDIPATVHTPVTFESASDDLYVSIHEAALRRYSSMTVDVSGQLRMRSILIPYSDETTTKVFTRVPFHTPWRTIQISDSAGGLLTSTLILNLNDENELGDVSWFEPGKYVGIWWEIHIGHGTWSSGPRHAANTENTKKYIDFAATHGFQGVLVEGWNPGWDGDWVAEGFRFDFTKAYPDYDIYELGKYAKSKNVYLVGHHETGANIDNYEKQMPEAFQLMEDVGAKAVKTGYVEHGTRLSNGLYHHGQGYIDHFQRVLKLAAKHKIAIVAHEPIKSTGERRTFPNLISTEGARGQEYNAWGANGGNPAEHTVILPFTRCLGGPMDFTPGVFDITLPNRPDNQINTTLAKQLALYVTIYSPMQMACDMPENYEKYQDAFQFIKDVGVDWETSLVPEAKIGDYLTMARKEKGSGNWFIGSITDENPHEVSIDLDFLDDGQAYTATLYKDASDAHFRDNPEAYVIEKIEVKKGDQINASLAAGGGLAVSIIKKE